MLLLWELLGPAPHTPAGQGSLGTESPSENAEGARAESKLLQEAGRGSSLQGEVQAGMGVPRVSLTAVPLLPQVQTQARAEVDRGPCTRADAYPDGADMQATVTAQHKPLERPCRGHWAEGGQ